MSKLTLNTPNKTSSAGVWIQWHKDLKSELGKSDANSIFIKYWAVRQSSAANTTELREYAKSQGFKIEGGVLGSIVDAGGDVFDTLGGMFKIGKYAAIGMGVIIIGGVAMLVFNIAKNPIGAANAAASLRTGGIVK